MGDGVEVEYRGSSASVEGSLLICEGAFRCNAGRWRECEVNFARCRKRRSLQVTSNIDADFMEIDAASKDAIADPER